MLISEAFSVRMGQVMLPNKQAPNIQGMKQQRVNSHYPETCVILQVYTYTSRSVHPHPHSRTQTNRAATISTLPSDYSRGKKSMGKSAVTETALLLLFIFHWLTWSHMAKPDFKRMRMKEYPVGRGREYWWTIIQFTIHFLGTLFQIAFLIFTSAKS